MIESTVSNDIISYTQSETHIRWKSKILLIQFRDKEDVRIIEKIEIR
jgi:hypothetical protein